MKKMNSFIKCLVLKLWIVLILFGTTNCATDAQTGKSRLRDAGIKTVTAVTLTDAQITHYAREYTF